MKKDTENRGCADVKERLFMLRDKEYARFQSRLTPNVPPDKFIGVRVPDVRALAKAFVKEPGHTVFMNSLPHEYYDENMLHALLISEIKEYPLCIGELEKFLPFVDNWAVCDVMSPKIFRKNRAELINKVKMWIDSSCPYTRRFGLEMLMSHYLDEDFDPEYLELAASVVSDDYYVKMMAAWYFATALTKQWEAAFPYMERNRLEKWIHNKTIQKACESYRISDAEKALLKSLKRQDSSFP